MAREVMISSTFLDLEEHRATAILALQRAGFFPRVMETYTLHANDTVLASSLRMVSESYAYVLIIGHRYGHVIVDPELNPEGVSVTELEYLAAEKRGLKILPFVMHRDHPLTIDWIEVDGDAQQRLATFRERVARGGRVCVHFNSLNNFAEALAAALGNLRLEFEREERSRVQLHRKAQESGLLTAPTQVRFRAVPDYVASHHQFIGRVAELECLDAWSANETGSPMMLVDAMGGMGKSMLTWEWAKRLMASDGSRWEKCFWYSFYEQGATMTDCCRTLYLFLSGQTRFKSDQSQFLELTRNVLVELNRRKCVVILDGLERILVSYHRADASSMRDEEAGIRDVIGDRHPRSAIMDRDDEFLRQLSEVRNSKVLVTSRLVPHALLSRSGVLRPGVTQLQLKGLLAEDAELLFKSSGVQGSSAAIRRYLKENCDCHPLVVGALAGIVNDYIPSRGHFDAWLADPRYQAGFSMGKLDLTQRKTHILSAAVQALGPDSIRLLSTLAMAPIAPDYETLSQLHQMAADSEGASRKSGAPPTAPNDATHLLTLDTAIIDLQNRGLLQHDPVAQRFDLHPVVRAVVMDRMELSERGVIGSGVVDYFNLRRKSLATHARSLSDLQDASNLIRALQQLNRLREAGSAYMGDFADALIFGAEGYVEALALLRPFFPGGWSGPAREASNLGYLANSAGLALGGLCLWDEALDAHGAALSYSAASPFPHNLAIDLLNIARAYHAAGHLVSEAGCLAMVEFLAPRLKDKSVTETIPLRRARLCLAAGDAAGAEKQLPTTPSSADLLDERAVVECEVAYAMGLLALPRIEKLATSLSGPRSRVHRRTALCLAGRLQIDKADAKSARQCFVQAAELSREAGFSDDTTDALISLADARLSGSIDSELARRDRRRIDPEALLPLAEALAISGSTQAASELATEAWLWAFKEGAMIPRHSTAVPAKLLLERLGCPLPRAPAQNIHLLGASWFKQAAQSIENQLGTADRVAFQLAVASGRFLKLRRS